MDVGPRIVLLTLLVSCCVGVYWKSWNVIWQSLLSIVGINFLLKMVNQECEEILMEWVHRCENWVWSKICLNIAECSQILAHSCWAMVNGVRAIIRGRQYPRISDV